METSLHLGDGEVQVTAGIGISSRVHFFLGDKLVAVGPYTDQESRERHLLSTIGGGNWRELGGDEFLFFPDSGKLASLWLKTSESLLDDDDLPEAWLEVPRTPAGLNLARCEGFAAPNTSCFWMADDGSHLAGFVGDPEVPRSTAERLTVAESLDLLFNDGEYSGWLLRDPERHISPKLGFENSEDPDEQLATWLWEYFDIVRAPYTDDMVFKDQEVLGWMRELLAEIDDSKGARSRRAILRGCLEELINWFY